MKPKPIVKDEAKKLDADKPPIGLISRVAIEEEAKVMAYGEKKYGRHNWRKGMNHTRCLDAAMRHILAYNDGEDVDPETGLSHLAHARCCLAFVLEFGQRKLGTDDRYGKQT